MTPATSYLLYMVFALGGAAVYLLLPKGDRSHLAAGGVIGLLAIIAWLVVLAVGIVAPEGTSVLFYLFATIAIVAAVRVVTHPKPVYSAVYFVLVVVAVAALLLLQHAEFLAIALLIIYAGAILVTYLFVIMLSQQGGETVYDRHSREPVLAVLAGFALMAAIAGHVGEVPASASASVRVVPAADQPGEVYQAQPGNTYAIGSAVMTRYVVALEIAGVLLLVSMVGAISLSRKKVPSEIVDAERKPIGQAGREVEPY